MSGARASYSRTELPSVDWRISSRSDSGGASCVEAGPVQDNSGRVAVRHSHHPDGRVIVYGREQWGEFLSRVKRGDFDAPA